VRNVAISGSYGAGKSSVLNSYKKKHIDKKFIHISLAHFRSTDSKGSSTTDSNDGTTETILEGKILNQLIHQIPPNRIPRTNFRVKKDMSKMRTIPTVFLIGAGIILGLYSFFFERWVSFLQSLSAFTKNVLAFSEYLESRLIAGLVFFFIVGVFVYRLVKLQANRHIIKKADVQGLQIELFGDSDETRFDKYLNEVLYLFENVDAEVIVFEDIDRYDSIGIFERLREINTLVNNNRKNSSLRFFILCAMIF